MQDNWALKLMGADEAWKSGYDGSGIVIGLIDTGVWLDHEQLRDNFRGGTNSWFDPVTGSRIPFDSRGHGTGVISCAAGMNKNDNMIGVAPGVRWIAALANYKNYYNNIFMNSCADWMLTVGKPDIVINAWSHGNISCDAFDLDFINAFKAAEILPIFAAGNQGPREGSSESPADLLTSFPKALPVFAVGSVNSEATISKFSSRGPSRCTGEMFPTIVAPGEEVYFAYPMQSNSYIAYSGTSPACAYAAGAAALAMQKYPEMGVDEIEQLFREHSKDCGTPGPDNQYGYGLIDLTSLLDLP